MPPKLPSIPAEQSMLLPFHLQQESQQRAEAAAAVPLPAPEQHSSPWDQQKDEAEHLSIPPAPPVLRGDAWGGKGEEWEVCGTIKGWNHRSRAAPSHQK